jgi:excinuclease ABC subunit C
MTVSGLDSVPGLGETRRKALLRHFGSVKRLGQATPEEIAEVPGIGRRTAEGRAGRVNPPAAPAAESPEPGAIPPGGAGRTKAVANRIQAGLPAPAPVKTSAVRAALADADTGSDVDHRGPAASA